MVGTGELQPESRALVAAYWWQRAAGEMASWIGWRHVLEDLRAESSPGAVLALAERAVSDEHQHALWCRDWAVKLGHPGGDIVPRGERRLTFGGATERENRLLRIAFTCFAETVGCFTLRRVRESVSDPALRKLNQRHLADELQHGRVGWAHLSTIGEKDAVVVRAAVPELLSLLAHACCDGDEQERDDLVPFGYFTPTLLRAAHDDAVKSVILPGLRHLGLEATS